MSNKQNDIINEMLNETYQEQGKILNQLNEIIYGRIKKDPDGKSRSSYTQNTTERIYEQR